MTKFIVLTLFPEMFENFIQTSIIKRSIEAQFVSIELVNIRDFSKDKNRKVDDTPYGGGSGMVIKCEPLDGAIKYALERVETNTRIIYLSPRGKLLEYSLVNKLSSDNDSYILICGHYEGIDERIITKYNIEEISIGDYVLTGGELPAMVLMDSVIRLKPNVLTAESLDAESHTNILLEYPQYTKPSEYDNMKVPEVLLNGNHKKIEEYRKNEAILITYKNRKDILKKALKDNVISKDEIKNIKGGK